MSDYSSVAWIPCAWIGITVLCIPLLWRIRARGPSYAAKLGATVWWLRGIGLVFLVFAFWSAYEAGQETGQLIRAMLNLVVSMPLIMLSGVIARLLIGPTEMKLESEHLRLFWKATTMVGIGILIASVFLYLASLTMSKV